MDNVYARDGVGRFAPTNRTEPTISLDTTEPTITAEEMFGKPREGLGKFTGKNYVEGEPLSETKTRIADGVRSAVEAGMLAEDTGVTVRCEDGEIVVRAYRTEGTNDVDTLKHIVGSYNKVGDGDTGYAPAFPTRFVIETAKERAWEAYRRDFGHTKVDSLRTAKRGDG